MFTTRVLMCGFDCDLNGPDCVARVRLLINEIIYPVYCCVFALSVNIVSLSKWSSRRLSAYLCSYFFAMINALNSVNRQPCSFNGKCTSAGPNQVDL